jgi:hypothetical protein
VVLCGDFLEFFGATLSMEGGKGLLFFYPGDLTGREVDICFMSRFAVKDGHDAEDGRSVEESRHLVKFTLTS